MVSYTPNVGGPIGLADLYVDRALVSIGSLFAYPTQSKQTF